MTSGVRVAHPHFFIMSYPLLLSLWWALHLNETVSVTTTEICQQPDLPHTPIWLCTSFHNCSVVARDTIWWTTTCMQPLCERTFNWTLNSPCLTGCNCPWYGRCENQPTEGFGTCYVNRLAGFLMGVGVVCFLGCLFYGVKTCLRKRSAFGNHEDSEDMEE